MESHRLKPMVENYDVKLFEKLYSKTEGLRKKLASEINPHIFGMGSDDILSWFNDKFIFAFNKYYPIHKEEILLGHIISSMQFFKCRILRSAYSEKYSTRVIQVENPGTLSDLFVVEETSHSIYLEKLDTFLKKKLSENAYYLLQIQLNPPPYILHQLKGSEDAKKLIKIKDELILEYFDIPENKKTLRYVAGLKDEIKSAITSAKSHFKHEG